MRRFFWLLLLLQGAFSQYTHAALDEMNALKSSFTASAPSKEAAATDSSTTTTTAMDDMKQRMAEAGAKGQDDPIAIAKEKAAETIPSPSSDGVGHKLLAAGGDDVLTVLSDGGESQEDPLKATMRVTTEMLS